MSRRQRTSSILGGDPRGDTGAPALSTFNSRRPSKTPYNVNGKKPEMHIRRRKQAPSILTQWTQLSLQHTWLNPLILILIVLTGYSIHPNPHNPLHRAIFLSYPLTPYSGDGPTTYTKGLHDLTFVAFYTIVFSFTREFIMQRFLRPLALSYGIRSWSKQSRFMEQTYTALYFSILGPFGLYVMSRSPVWYFNTTAMFEGYPHIELDVYHKAYYLLQASYWAQQAIVLVLLLEKPRKDFKELIVHHILTLALIFLSYRFHFTYIGIAVFVTHDISDWFLATSKTLNYISSPATPPFFILFLTIWIYCRHYLNLRLLYSIATEFRTVGPFDLNWENQQYKCWISQYITFGLLSGLQGVNCLWLGWVLRVAWGYVRGEGRRDGRSDDEDEDEDEEEEEEEEEQEEAKKLD